MNDPGLNSLLKWSVENSDKSRNNGDAAPEAARQDAGRGLDAEALAQLLGGPSDADRMREAMAAIEAEDVSLENKLIAFDNLEQLVEQIDNANNLESLGLWMPLIAQLESQEADMQLQAAWVVGTAVQNNLRAQERCLVLGAIPKLLEMALKGTDAATRKKAIRGLSSAVRNYQPAFDAFLEGLPEEYKSAGKIDAGDMKAVDHLMNKLRDHASR